ncbi:hypothetical protein TOT_020000068 [Theileria orientalis strain Shintoku]|uniref:Uncharacterized protein n=1 Tax=Theileria orientalis strain Shintoku TaxID=869250 RepID=J4CCQ4_THEOR|nr:hypothetical protein TOT_020000068 [Theileria orientalis strain Shintoku]PVC50217.1 hypothetical protein MACL_00002419 [Theileria orientalis]BAM39797.1 hypothetical protein TOT_020000068 [Theileria orientalis strain Shintoku]|eukprot:XP_009690098.1 hypothetical protein TOT_020000068 [Theileria orientalis strain Shintoku]
MMTEPSFLSKKNVGFHSDLTHAAQCSWAPSCFHFLCLSGSTTLLFT